MAMWSWGLQQYLRAYSEQSEKSMAIERFRDRQTHGCYVRGQCGNLLNYKMAAREEMWTRNNGWVRGCYEQHLCELISLFTERFSQNEWLLEVLWASLFRTIPRCPMSEQECRIDYFRVTLVAKAFGPYASSLKFCQTSGKFSYVDEVLSFLSMYVAAPRVLWLLRALQDCGSSCRLAIDGMSCGRLQVLFPFQRYALPGKRL